MNKLKPRPSFFQFRDILMEIIITHTGTTGILPEASWLDQGHRKARLAILNNFKEKIESDFNVEMVIDSALADSNITLESLANQLHHTFSTVHLMERINQKIRNSMN